MALDLGVFCKSTLDGELVEHCFSSIFGLSQNVDPSYLDWLIKAWGWTLAVAGLSLIIALVLGAVFGTLRTLPDTSNANKWLIRFSTAWVELFRHIPRSSSSISLVARCSRIFSTSKGSAIILVGQHCFRIFYLRPNCGAG